MFSNFFSENRTGYEIKPIKYCRGMEVAKCKLEPFLTAVFVCNSTHNTCRHTAGAHVVPIPFLPFLSKLDHIVHASCKAKNVIIYKNPFRVPRITTFERNDTLPHMAKRMGNFHLGSCQKYIEIFVSRSSLNQNCQHAVRCQLC
jgi:hypothetical protein